MRLMLIATAVAFGLVAIRFRYSSMKPRAQRRAAVAAEGNAK
jgi:hypothetical protein